MVIKDVKNSYKPLVITEPGKEIFKLEIDGSIWADWATLKMYYDKFVSGDNKDQTNIICAALWAARNK